ncbi:hypothetical protein ACHQM5_004583 [Ranunculus cassubicifolius]
MSTSSTLPNIHILVIPFQGHGHLFPSIELSKRLSSSLNYKTTLVVPSSLSSSLPQYHPLYDVFVLTSPPPILPPPDSLETDTSQHSHHHHHHRPDMVTPFTDLLSKLSYTEDPPSCAIIDVMCDWAYEPCQKFDIPTVGFLTSGGTSAAIELAFGKLSPDTQTSGHAISLPGLPEHIRVSLVDPAEFGPDRHDPPGLRPDPSFTPGMPPPPGPPFRQGPPGPPEPSFRRGPLGPPFIFGPGSRPQWVSVTEKSVALMINTCEDLERPFTDYLRKEIEKHVFCVGPLLPEAYSKTIGSTVHDQEFRSKHDQNNLLEEEVTQWLDTKPHGSVIYVSFGSEVGPSTDELTELAIALHESDRFFIWVLPLEPRNFGPPRGRGPPASENIDPLPDGYMDRIEGRGLVIRGWAPQLLILSHESTGGFISHGGWNSTLEAILRGVPLLMWPIRGDQHYNAKLIVDHLKVGFMIKGNGSQIELVKREDILKGIENLMADEHVKKEVASLASIFENGFSPSYKDWLNSFNSFVNQILKEN